MAVQFNASNKSKQCFTDIPVYTVKAVKSFQGREGMGFECALYKDGKRIGKAVDVANGGGMVAFYLNDGEEEKFEAYCKTLPKEQWDNNCYLTEEQWDRTYPDGRAVDSHHVMCKMVDEFETNKKFKRQCKKYTLVFLKDAKKGTYYKIPVIYSQQVKTIMKNKYGKNLKEIINERFE